MSGKGVLLAERAPVTCPVCASPVAADVCAACSWQLPSADLADSPHEAAAYARRLAEVQHRHGMPIDQLADSASAVGIGADAI